MTNKEQASILDHVNFVGFKRNCALDYSFSFLVLAQRFSKITNLEEDEIVEIREKMLNELLALIAKLSMLKKYTDVNLMRLKYCLSVFVDGLLMQNVAFLQSSYANNTLSIRLFNEAAGGDKFFGVMDKWLENPIENKDLLEVIYVCLLLGYKGKFSLDPEGEAKISYLCDNIISGLAPTLKGGGNVFKYGYKNTSYDMGGMPKHIALALKIFVWMIPLLVVVFFYFYEFFGLRKVVQQTEKNFQSKIELQMKMEANGDPNTPSENQAKPQTDEPTSLRLKQLP